MAYRDTEEYRLKHAELAKAAYHRNKDKHKEWMRRYRNTDEAKKKRKDYVEKNKARILKQERITKSRHYKKQIDAITDEYVIRLLLHPTEIKKHGLKTVNEVRSDKELILQKRKSVAISRVKKAIKKIDDQ